MELVSFISVKTPGGLASIQLLYGDLSSISSEHEVDLLVVSAFPNDYTPVNGTLIGALDAKGLSMNDIAEEKETDLRMQLGCWLSKPLHPDLQKKFHFKRILCFEPLTQSNAAYEIVGNVFRCINAFAFEMENNIVAMPVLAAGNQNVPVEKMLPALLEAAIFWLKQGLPLKCIKLVVYDERKLDTAKTIFTEAKKNFAASEEKEIKFLKANSKKAVDRNLSDDMAVSEEKGTFSPPENGEIAGNYDIFISYAHKQTPVINDFVKSLLNKKSSLNVFFDRQSIQPGALWLKHISDAIQSAKKVLIFLSPDYSASPVCWDEFQCAKLMEYNSGKQLIQTVYLYSDKNLPPIMGIHSWIDCREGDIQKLSDCIAQII